MGVAIVKMLIGVLVLGVTLFFKLLYTLLMKFRLMGVFLWIMVLFFAHWNKETAAKFEPYATAYAILGLIVLIGTIISMITAVVRYWKPGFNSIDLFTGAPDRMDVRYYQTVSSLEDLKEQHAHGAIQASMLGKKKELQKREREYEYLKRKFKENVRNVS